ncbi:MAG: DNA polymerase III subunit [Oscillospiraceae bacterium]|jgi:DNA polymerase-3 subunit delta'|nr:DNA polymerase III subunit [Oscillospiraceae bacterium]
MGFGTFLGNEMLKQRLTSSLAQGQLSHCYLIAGPHGSGKHTLAKLLCAAMQCVQKDKPCLRCSGCRKVLGDVHPDICVIDEPEKKTIPVKLVRDACADLYIRPNEGAKKIYLIPRAQDLNPQGQNALLKCMEEPPSYGVFILLTTNADAMLSTILSRCVLLRLAPLQKQTMLPALRERFAHLDDSALEAAYARSGGYLGQAMQLLADNAAIFPQSEAFLRAYAENAPTALLRVLTPMERMTREQLRPIFEQWRELLTNALECRSGGLQVHPLCREVAQTRSVGAMLAASDALREALELLSANVSAGHICGALTIKLR